MALSTYSDLRSSVLSWMTRADSVAADKVPDFIRLGETRLFRRLRLSGMVSLPTVLTVVAGTNYAALPDDWLAFKRIGKVGQYSLGYVSPEQMAELADGYGDPSAYSVEGNRFMYGQTPAADLPVSVAYFQRPKALDVEPSNWVLTANPDLYLYAALIEGWQWAQNSAKAGEYGILLEKALDDAHTADKAAAISGATLRTRRP